MWEIIKALMLTIIIEGIVIFLLKRKFIFVLYSIIINIITNLSLNIIVSNCLQSNLWIYIIGVVILEIVVLFAEVLMYNIIIKKFKESFILSLILNVISLSFGFLMYLPI